ncbi:hypothetical protein N7508_000197 [Penicillium antarcticum]|uniref:uncharacterized protein n=1 Tax=Penicillium antarcticum TaxID=416450 RepID=UPI00239D8372|nr:uncharacterized protein N7508_000197 [Penicillium antarcticum]KAJ5319914.1 hypothetical protein N7508_000197 [Penicillium antarcticum]
MITQPIIHPYMLYMALPAVRACIVFEIPPKAPVPMRIQNRYWNPSRRHMLRSTTFCQHLILGRKGFAFGALPTQTQFSPFGR